MNRKIRLLVVEDETPIRVGLADVFVYHGYEIEQRPFLRGTVEAAFRETVLSRMSDLAVAYQGRVLAAFSAQPGAELRLTFPAEQAAAARVDR